jgi:hypothetical protein
MFVRRTGTADYKLLGLVQVMTLFLGGHDWLIQIGHMPFETAYGLPFVAPLLVAALGWLIAGDYARVQSDLKTLNNELTDRIYAKELALRESFEKLSLLEKERVVSQERTRIMRVMHDGVGMYLSSALRHVQSGQVGTALVEQTLRDSLDHLKLTVDSMGFREGDVCALLGSLRYRLVPKLEAVGLTLFWHVDDLPLWPSVPRWRALTWSSTWKTMAKVSSPCNGPKAKACAVCKSAPKAWAHLCSHCRYSRMAARLCCTYPCNQTEDVPSKRV